MNTEIDNNFQQGDDLWRVILKIIEDHQPIDSKDIWYELGEEKGLKGEIGGIPYDEITDILSQMEKQKIIIMEEHKWKIRKSIIEKPKKWIPNL